MELVDAMLELLRDSHWYLLDEIRNHFPLSERGCKKLIYHLEEIGFIKVDDDKKRAKISTLGSKFLELPPE